MKTLVVGDAVILVLFKFFGIFTDRSPVHARWIPRKLRSRILGTAMTSVLVTHSKYQFVPPHEGTFWPRLIGRFTPAYLSRRCGISRIEVEGSEILQNLLRQRHGVLLAPNHCRMTDAVVLQSLAHRAGNPFFFMASSHLFRGKKRVSWLLRRMGAFSIYREGMDRQSLAKGIELLAAAKRPLVVFPEGALSQANEHLQGFQEGISFMARTAAAKIQKDGDLSRRVYGVPVAIRYVYDGDIEKTAGDLLTSIEKRLSWNPRQGECLIRRIYRVGNALLSLKELEYLGTARTGALHDRINDLINHILVPQEIEWLGGAKQGTVFVRVQELRRAIMPAMVEGKLTAEEEARRWKLLHDSTLAQSLGLYPAQYVATRPTADRILETVERFHEQLSGEETYHGPMRVMIRVGEPIEVSTKRDRGADSDPLLGRIAASINEMLLQSAGHCTLYQAR